MLGKTMMDIGHHATTGSAAYDAICFSGEPLTDLCLCPESGIQVVRHIGMCMPGQARLVSHQPETDTLLLNLRSSGHYRGRCGSQEISRQLQRNHVTYIPGRHRTEMEFPAAHSVLAVFVPASYIRRILADIGSRQALPMHSERHDRLAQLIMMLESEIRLQHFASDVVVDGLLRAITTILVRHEVDCQTTDHDRIYLSPPRLARVLAFVEERLDGDIGLADMAHVSGLSPFHFSRMFKLATGETPYQFIGSRRIERARRLLNDGQMPLVELALSCGFASQSHFTAAFTRATGMPPGRYRKLLTNIFESTEQTSNKTAEIEKNKEFAYSI